MEGHVRQNHEKKKTDAYEDAYLAGENDILYPGALRLVRVLVV